MTNIEGTTAPAEPSSYVIAAFKRADRREFQHKKLTWDQIKTQLSTFTPMEGEKRNDGRIKTPTSAPCFIGGRFHDESNASKANLAVRSLAVLDYDDCPDDLAAVEFALEMWGRRCFAYSTWSNTADKAKFRVVVPLAYEASADQYSGIVRALVDEIGLDGLDENSLNPVLKMFEPAFEQGTDYDEWTFDGDGAIYRPAFDDIGDTFDTPSHADDLEITVADVKEPLQISEARIDRALSAVPAEPLDYDDWSNVGMALWHQFDGSDSGFERWLRWSELSSKHDPRQMRTKWRSFGGSANPRTFRSVLHMAKQNNPDWDLPEWARGWVYNETLLEFHQIETQHSIKASAFNMKFDRMPDCLMGGKDGKPTSATNLVGNRLRTVANKMYWPGMGEIMTHRGLDFVNTYRPHDVVPKAPATFDAECAVDAVVQHAHKLIPNEDEAELFLDFLAWVYQNPGKKMNWAIVLFGIEGNGKSFWMEGVMQKLLGHNANVVNGFEVISNDYTGWAEATQFVCIEEVHVPNEGKHKALNKLKPFITNETVQVSEKYEKARKAPNFASYMMLTNHRDALPLDDGDRRYCVIETWPEHSRDIPDKAYFDNLWAASSNHIEAIAHYFATRQVSKTFEPNGRAPMTAGKAIMMEDAKTGPQMAMEEAIEELKCDVIGDDIVYVGGLRDQAHLLNDDIENNLPPVRNMGKVLREMGYLKIVSGKGAQGPNISGTKRTIYYNPEMIDAGRAEARVRQHISGVPF